MKLRPNTAEESKYVDLLIKEGERIYSKSENDSHKVLEYVNTKLIAEGKRFKVPLIPGELVGYKPKNV